MRPHKICLSQTLCCRDFVFGRDQAPPTPCSTPQSAVSRDRYSKYESRCPPLPSLFVVVRGPHRKTEIWGADFLSCPGARARARSQAGASTAPAASRSRVHASAPCSFALVCQAEDRVNRIGQTQDVHIVWLRAFKVRLPRPLCCPSNITRDCPPSLLISQGIALPPF